STPYSTLANCPVFGGHFRQHYRRNVREDLRRFIDKDIRYIDAVAIMTDSDNSGQKAVTSYGDIFFTSH
ncbi:MAG: DUF3047 domain-containing protein, partial [Mariprofundaceae bacterium]|nr:DUF3047 domain-containing protein [Mariprofundaceae bacterium]